MRLIDADALIRELTGIKKTFGSGNGLVEGGIEIAISTTNAQQTVDAVERKRGRWIDLDSDRERYDDVMCSNCKKTFMVDAYRWCDIGFTVDDLKFCPNCGAEMRGEANECND